MKKNSLLTKSIWSIVTCGIILTGFASINSFAQDMPATETFLKKYTLTESFELGLEISYIVPHSSKTTNMGNIYMSLTHSSNTNSSFKFKTGVLSGEYLLSNQNIGRLYYVPVLTTFISSLEIFDLNNPKPYYGFGVGYYFFENFKSSQNQYRTYTSENTYGYHLVVGAKYISPWGLLIRGDMGYEIIKPPRFFNGKLGVKGTNNVRRINFSNLGFALNMSLYF